MDTQHLTQAKVVRELTGDHCIVRELLMTYSL
uniref:Uncharacterized protein n=1 Tax=Trichinella nativa TaxID=6335 RepID=A0A0V1KHI7_9BILA